MLYCRFIKVPQVEAGMACGCCQVPLAATLDTAAAGSLSQTGRGAAAAARPRLKNTAQVYPNGTAMPLRLHAELLTLGSYL